MTTRKPRSVDLKPAIGRRLKAARTIVFDTSDACAASLGVPKETWRHYEIGDRYPDPYWITRFCDDTGFTADFIYRGHFRGIREDVQIRLAAEYPDLVDAAPDMALPARARAVV